MELEHLLGKGVDRQSHACRRRALGSSRNASVCGDDQLLVDESELVAILSIVESVTADGAPARDRLSPRQRETLSLFDAGMTTTEIATELGVAHKTGACRRLQARRQWRRFA